MSRKFRVLGTDFVKVEALDKVTGHLAYSGDWTFPHTLYAKILRSPHPHARVIHVDVRKAAQLSGVKVVITHWDVPKVFTTHASLFPPRSPAAYRDSYLLEGTVRHVGDRVAAVAAVTSEIAEEALELIQVEYEPLPAVFDGVESLRPGAPAIHTRASSGGVPTEIKNNIVGELEVEIGDVARGLRESDLVIENEFRTSRPNNAPLERTVITCVPRPGGHLEVYATTQGIHLLRMNLARSLEVPLHKINVQRIYLGGSFGAHIHMGFLEPVVAFLALRTGQPVRGEMTREEMFLEYGRHPCVLRLRSGAKKDGTLWAQYMEVVDDTGSYAISGRSRISLQAGFFLSSYRCPNLKFVGKTVYTNTPPLCAMRGAGNPQVTFAVESQMNCLAEALGMDPVKLRLKNHLRVGDRFWGQGTDVISTVQSCGMEVLLREGARRFAWESLQMQKPVAFDKPCLKRGSAVAIGFHTSGAGTPEPSKFILDYGGAAVRINEDGTATLLTASGDYGGGTISALAAIVAEELGLDFESITVADGDTCTTQNDLVTHASRGVYVGGLAVQAAAKAAKETVFKWAAPILGMPATDLRMEQGRVCSEKDTEVSLPLKEVVEAAQSHGEGTIMGVSSIRPTACPPHFTAVFAEVEVDTETGQVKVLRTLMGVDAGTVINPKNLENQAAGGIHMGIGYALTEDTVIDTATGRLLNANFTDYKLLRATDMPEVEVFTVETYEPTAAFGAKGVGEGVTNPVAAAIISAIYDAIGVRIRDLPATPQKILKALGKI